jgi:hypothetical protein
LSGGDQAPPADTDDKSSPHSRTTRARSFKPLRTARLITHILLILRSTWSKPLDASIQRLVYSPTVFLPAVLLTQNTV